jgi:hypothetical protein
MLLINFVQLAIPSVLNFEILRISSFFAANLVGVFRLWTAKVVADA